MKDSDRIDWDEIKEAASKMFDVWFIGGELDWAKEVWSHLGAAGLASRQNFLDETAAKLRLVTLAKIYQEFCGLAWGEDPETPIDYLAEDLHIDPVALGVLAASTKCDELEEAVEDYELLQAALTAVTDNQRHEIFDCLKAAYGNEFKLYSRIWHTRSLEAEKDSEDDEWEVTEANSSALEYIQNGFRRSF
jgi:hypothetical protein